MNTEKIKQLIEKYYEGETSLEEERQLRDYFSKEEVPEELESHTAQFAYYDERSEQDTDFDPYAKIDFKEEGEVSTEKAVRQVGRSNKWLLRVAAGFILLLVGFSAGQFLSNGSGASTEQVAALQQEVQQMKEALMYGGNYRQASAGERLSAVKLSSELPSSNGKLDQQITDILIYTMNNDKSVNVRVAAAEALFRFRENPQIQRALVNALSEQGDPQMQIMLIDMLVQMKARGALNEMNKLLVNANTRDIVRDRLKAGIAELKI